MEKYRRVQLPKPQSKINENEIRITAVGKTRNYISYAANLLQIKGAPEIVLKAMGQAMNKTVTVAEILKRRIPDLHQITTIDSTHIKELWEPVEEGLENVETIRHVSSIEIILSKVPLDERAPGYQPPLPHSQVFMNPEPQRQFPQGPVPSRGGYRGRGRGGYGYDPSFIHRGRGGQGPPRGGAFRGFNRGRGAYQGRGGYGGRGGSYASYSPIGLPPQQQGPGQAQAPGQGQGQGPEQGIVGGLGDGLSPFASYRGGRGGEGGRGGFRGGRGGFRGGRGGNGGFRGGPRGGPRGGRGGGFRGGYGGPRSTPPNYISNVMPQDQGLGPLQQQ